MTHQVYQGTSRVSKLQNNGYTWVLSYCKLSLKCICLSGQLTNLKSKQYTYILLTVIAEYSHLWLHRSECSPCWNWTGPALYCLSVPSWQFLTWLCYVERTGSPWLPQTLLVEHRTTGRGRAWVKDSGMERKHSSTAAQCQFIHKKATSYFINPLIFPPVHLEWPVHASVRFYYKNAGSAFCYSITVMPFNGEIRTILILP